MAGLDRLYWDLTRRVCYYCLESGQVGRALVASHRHGNNYLERYGIYRIVPDRAVVAER